MAKSWLAFTPRLRSQKLWSLAGLGLTGLCLVWIGFIAYQDRRLIIQYIQDIQSVDLLSIAKVFSWYTLDLAIYIIAWISIFRKLGGGGNLLSHIRFFCLSNATKRLPGTVWYIGSRAVLYRQAGIPAKLVVFASGIEGGLIWLSGVLVALPYLIVSELRFKWLGVGVGLFVITIFLNPWTIRRVMHSILGRETSLVVVRSSEIYLWTTLYIASWIVGGVLLFSVLTIFQSLTLRELPTLVGIWALSGVFSMLTMLLPSSMGVMEASLVALLSTILSPGLAVLVAVSMRIVTTVLDMVWGGIAALLRWFPNSG